MNEGQQANYSSTIVHGFQWILFHCVLESTASWLAWWRISGFLTPMLRAECHLQWHITTVGYRMKTGLVHVAMTMTSRVVVKPHYGCMHELFWQETPSCNTVSNWNKMSRETTYMGRYWRPQRRFQLLTATMVSTLLLSYNKWQDNTKLGERRELYTLRFSHCL